MGKAIIIGGTSGIGLATAQRLSESNTGIIVAGRDPKKLEGAVQKLGGSAGGYLVDARSEEQLVSFYQKIGAFDHLILSISGAKGGGSFASLDLSMLHEGFEAKFWAMLKSAQLALPYITHNGSITFVTAASAQRANPGTAGLAAINGALERMIPVLAVELAPIRVNGVSPGIINTPWWNGMPVEQRQIAFQHFAQSSLMGRVGKPEDIAEAIQFIVESTYITGQVIVVDGGLGLKGNG